MTCCVPWLPRPKRRSWRRVTRANGSPRRGDRDEFATLLPRHGDACKGTEVSHHDDVIVMRSPGGFTFCLTSWSDVGSWQRRAGTLPEFVSLTRPDGIPVRLLFQRLGETTGTVRGHLDFACRDRELSRSVHVAAGATVVSEHEFSTVMRDPVGRAYCLTHRQP